VTKSIYIFRAKLSGWQGVRRTIAMESDSTLVDLHGALQRAFDWDGSHSYAFWRGGKFWAKDEVEYVDPLALDDGAQRRAGRAGRALPVGLRTAHLALAKRVKSAERRLEKLHLSEGQRLSYVFDFNEQWRVRLKLREISSGDGGIYPRMLELVGVAPPQYLDYEAELAA
jgi:hypothetical protein